MEIADRRELLEILTERAREGSVTAAKALLGELRLEEDGSDDADGFDALDNVTEIGAGRDRKAS